MRPHVVTVIEEIRRAESYYLCELWSFKLLRTLVSTVPFIQEDMQNEVM